MRQSNIYHRWLEDALAVETAVAESLEKHATTAAGLPDMKSKLTVHHRDTLMHIQRLRECLTRNGVVPSAIKTSTAKLVATIQSLTGGRQDSIMTNALSDIASEYYEIAMYKTIISAAQQIGDYETARICQEILDDEMKMASWLDAILPALTLSHVEDMMRADQGFRQSDGQAGLT